MSSINKVRIVAALAAIALPCVVLVLAGPAFEAAAHVFRQWFDALSPEARSRAALFGRSLPYWLPGTAAVFAAVLGMLRRRREKQADDGLLDDRSHRFQSLQRQELGDGR